MTNEIEEDSRDYVKEFHDDAIHLCSTYRAIIFPKDIEDKEFTFSEKVFHEVFANFILKWAPKDG